MSPFPPDGKTLAYNNGSIAKLWDLASGQERASLRGHTADIGYLAFSPDGKTLATGALDGTVKLWDVTTGQQTARKPYGSTVACITFSPDGKALVVGGESALVQVWETASGNRPLNPSSTGILGLGHFPELLPRWPHSGRRQLQREDQAVHHSHLEGAYYPSRTHGRAPCPGLLSRWPDSRLRGK